MFTSTSIESGRRANKIKLFGGVALLYCGAIFSTGNVGSSQAAAAGVQPVRQCAELVKLTFEGNTTITAAEVVMNGTIVTPAGQTISGLPEFCRVVGLSKPSADSNINFEVWLPTKAWNGKFMSAGEGSFAGAINYTRLGLDGYLDENLKRGYVTASTDTGHLASDEFWAIGHPERVIDFGYRAKHLVTVAAKGLIQALYGKAADYSYYNSCSAGGRQGLMEMQRYPNDYDGVVVGAPAAFHSNVYTWRAWLARLLAAPSASISPAKFSTIQAAAVAACDKLDGAADGLIEDPRKCGFDPSALLCTADDNDNCLTAVQIETVKKIYAGLSDPPLANRFIRDSRVVGRRARQPLRRSTFPWRSHFFEGSCSKTRRGTTINSISRKMARLPWPRLPPS